jgi:FHS family glucose/mannose:H+ symporter-like MFS transporter
MNDKRLRLFIPVACGLTFFLGAESGGFQLILFQAAREFGLTIGKMGILVAAQYSAITLGPLIFGWIGDRIGKKKVLLISMPLFAAGCFCAALSGTVAVFGIAVFVVGFGYSVCESIGSSALSDSFPDQEGRYLNFMQCTFSLGAVLSPLVFNKLISLGAADWRTVFLTAGGGYVFLYPLLILSHCKETATGKEKSAVAGIISPLLLALVVAMLFYVAMETGVAFFADSLFVTEYANTEMGAYAISGFWFAMTVSRLIFAMSKIKPKNMVLGGFAAAFFFFVLIFFLRFQLVLMGIFLCLGFVMGPVWPMIIGIGTSSNRKRSGTTASILTASGGLGGAVIPIFFGITAEKAGFYYGFCLLAAVSALGFLVMRFGNRPVNR